MSKRVALLLSLLFLAASCILIQTSRANVVDAANATAKEKLPAFLSDVIGLDLAKYNITNEGYSASYPSEFNGLVKRENTGFTLESNDGKVSVSCMVNNGLICWLHVNRLNGSLVYATQPSTDALVESRSILQRYQVFAQKYGINAVNVASALNLLSNVPDAPPADEYTSNFNKMSDFAPANATLGDMKLHVSQTSIGFWYTTNGVDVKNKYFGMNFGYDTFVFWDSWNLYSIGSFSVLSEEEATSMAFDVAKAYSLNRTWYQTDENNVTTVVKPDWSQMMSDVGFNMIPGQIYNNSLNDALLAKGVGVNMGNTTRNPLALYPFWSTIFFFTKPMGNIAGIQVGLWSDTKEIAYCMEYGYLGSSGQPSTSISDPEQSPTSTPDNSGQSSTSTTQPSLLPTEVIICTVLAATIAVTLAAIVIKKKRR
jgi:hypothetical protein